MKKLLVITTLLFLACISAQASTIVMDYQGETLVHSNSVERNLLLNSDDDTLYDIAIRPLDDALRSNDGSVSIPLDRVYFNNTKEDIYVRYNEYSNLFRNIQMAGFPKHLTVKVRDFGMIPAGVYNLNVEIQGTDLNSGMIASQSTFNLQFIVPVSQSLNLNTDVSKLEMSVDKAFKKNKRITTEQSPMIYINSNVDWELLLSTNNLGETVGDYYIRTISGSDMVNERLQERVLLEPNREYVIARGKAPSNNQYITVEFSMENRDGRVIRAGNYENNIRYILKEDRGR